MDCGDDSPLSASSSLSHCVTIPTQENAKRQAVEGVKGVVFNLLY